MALARYYSCWWAVTLYIVTVLLLCSKTCHSLTTCQTYTVKSGDTCYQISQSYGISLSLFLSWNQGIVCNNLQIGQQVCVSAPTTTSGPGNGKIFREYIGAYYNGVKLSSVPIVNKTVEVHLILSFAIDYTSDGSASTNGKFSAFWDTSAITPAAVKAIKTQYSNVKVMLSLGGDTVNNKYVQFKPSTVSSWVSNAVTSLTSLIQTYNLDGIDIDYEHFDYTTNSNFASAIGQLVTQLKQNKVISIASIAPFDDVKSQYTTLWAKYNTSVFDYVNFQFYTYGSSTSASQFVTYYNAAAAAYPGGKILASFTTETDFDTVSPSTVLSACKSLKNSNSLPGIFVWCADTSYASSSFLYEKQAQSLLAS